MDMPILGGRFGGGWVSHVGRVTRRDCLRAAVDLATEVAIIWSFLKAYNVVRDRFGSTAVSPQTAAAHALQVVQLERRLGFFWEQSIQAAALQWLPLVRFLNVYYWAAHMASTVGTLLLVFFLRPSMYQRARSAFLVMNLLALIGYAAFPLMPPRLLNDCDTQFGGCQPGFHFVDTMDVYGGLWSWRNSSIAKVSNHFAAMPSMHFGYSLWVAVTVMQFFCVTLQPCGLHKGLALFALLYPLSVLTGIVVTGNHFIFDAVCGSVALAAGHYLSYWVPPLGRGAHPDRPPWLGGRGRHGKLPARDASDCEEGPDDEDTKQLLPHRGPSAVVLVDAPLRSGSVEVRRTAACEGRLEPLGELRCISVKSS